MNLSSFRFTLLLIPMLIPAIISACLKSAYPVYVCTHPLNNVDYYSECLSDLASDWIKVHDVCHPKMQHYTAECNEDLSSVHITSHVRINYHRSWWGHRLRPIKDLPFAPGVYQSKNHSAGVKQDQLCVRSSIKLL